MAVPLLHLHDPQHPAEWLINGEHVSAFEYQRDTGAVKIFLLGGQTIDLKGEPAKQFLRHLHPHQRQP